MILSANFLNYYLIKYSNENIREYYNQQCLEKAIMIYIATVFMIIELILLYYAVLISLRISRNNTERLIFIILSITYTTPFILFMLLFNEDARKSLA